MKRLFALIMAILTVIFLVACANTSGDDKKDGGETLKLDGHDTVDDKIIKNYFARYIRTGWGSDQEYPYIFVIRSYDEFSSYMEKVSSSMISCYDEDYFEEMTLLVAVLQEGSGSIRHELKGIDENGTIHIDRIVPEVGTCDMAAWNIVIEIPVEMSDEDFTIEYSDINTSTEVSYGEGYTYIFSKVPEGWDSEILMSTDADCDFSIHLYPHNKPESYVSISYYNGFGLCGTGLESSEITIGEYNATRHKYDGGPWTIYIFKDLPGTYVVDVSTNIAKNYDKTVKEILLSLRLSPEWIIREKEAVEIAMNQLSGECTLNYASFDSENGNWTIRLRKNGKSADDDHTVVLDWSGDVISVD